MPGRTVTFSVNRHRAVLNFEHASRESNGDGSLIVLAEDLRSCTATDLRLAIAHMERTEYGDGSPVQVSNVPSEHFDNDLAPYENYGFSIDGLNLVIEIEVMTETESDDETENRIRRWLEPLARRHRAVVGAVEPDSFQSGGPVWFWTVKLIVATRGRSMSSMIAIAEEAEALLHAVDSGELSRETARDLILSGHAAALVGHFENGWLEVKSAEYDLTALVGKVSLAEAVAGLANSPDGGLVVVGLRTKTRDGGAEFVSDVTPMRPDPSATRRYKRVLQNHVYPPPLGLTIVQIEQEGGRLMLIDIPPQPEELRPFLVHGVVIDGRNRGSFIGVATRQGDENIPQTAAMIHATLAAGRALLRLENHSRRLRDALESDPNSSQN